MFSEKKSVAIYLISDSSGETVLSVSKAVIAQFCDIAAIEEYIWTLVRSKTQIDEAIDQIKQQDNGVVFYTVTDQELRDYLEHRCREIGVVSIFLLKQCFEAIAGVLGIKTPITGAPGKYKVLDESYYRRIDVINYTVQHDDGQVSDDYDDADILLLGISRTSKSPTALYLAQRGFKTANIPIVKNLEIQLAAIKKPVIVGFMISADMLAQIRSNRALRAGSCLLEEDDVYVSLADIKDELRYAKKIFSQFNIPVVDVTRKAVEEIAAEVINLYCQKRGDHRMKV